MRLGAPLHALQDRWLGARITWKRVLNLLYLGSTCFLIATLATTANAQITIDGDLSDWDLADKITADIPGDPVSSNAITGNYELPSVYVRLEELWLYLGYEYLDTSVLVPTSKYGDEHRC